MIPNFSSQKLARILATGLFLGAGGVAQEPSGATPLVLTPPLQPVVAEAAQVLKVSAEAVGEKGGEVPGARRLNEFQGDDLGLVLRTLARHAALTVVVSDKAAETGGSVTARIENKTPQEALEILVESKGLVLDHKNGVFFVKTQEEKAKEPTQSASYTLSYGVAKDVLPLLQAQLQSGVAPQADLRTNTVFFRENQSNVDKILKFLETVDRPTQQVMIEARLVEVNANPKQSYGINWAGVLGGSSNPQTFRFGGSSLESRSAAGALITPSGPVIGPNGQFQPNDFVRGSQQFKNLGKAVGGQFAILSAPQMSFTLRMLNEDSDAEFLANQRVVTTSNGKAEVKVIRSQPVPKLNFNEQTAQAVFSGFDDKEFGNTLEVTPIVNKDNFISLVVKPEISNKVDDVKFVFGNATVTSPIIDKRTLNSNVLIRSGDTLAIGGLMQDEGLKTRAKVPLLGDIPLLGYAFQERLNDRKRRNLLVFVTPTVLQPGRGTGLESQANGLKDSGEIYADPNGWRNNAKGAIRLVPTSRRPNAADLPKPGIPASPLQSFRKRDTGLRAE
jgi:type IV pilus assembly protein PilQ